MTPEPGPALVARIVYLSLVASVLVFTGIATVVRGIQPPLLQASLVYARTNLPRAILVWGLLEGGALFGAVLCFTSQSYVPLAVTACGLLLLVLTAPSRLTGR